MLNNKAEARSAIPSQVSKSSTRQQPTEPRLQVRIEEWGRESNQRSRDGGNRAQYDGQSKVSGRSSRAASRPQLEAYRRQENLQAIMEDEEARFVPANRNTLSRSEAPSKVSRTSSHRSYRSSSSSSQISQRTARQSDYARSERSHRSRAPSTVFPEDSASNITSTSRRGLPEDRTEETVRTHSHQS